MTKEELGNAAGKDLIEQRDYCGIDSYYSDYLDDVNAEMLKRFNSLTELEAQTRWHKVADGDLPKEQKDIIMSDVLLLVVKRKLSTEYIFELGKYNFSEKEFEYAHVIGLTDVIAWCEIPQFKEE